jgi:hypothetical protein
MVRRILFSLLFLTAASGLSSAQFVPEFFQTTAEEPLGGNYIGNVIHPGTWLTAEVWVTQRFQTSKVAIVIEHEDKATTCVTHSGDCALTNTYDIGLRCVAFCANPGQLVLNTGPLVICTTRTSGSACISSLVHCADASGTNHCPYQTPPVAVTYPWKQAISTGPVWIEPGIYAEETGSSNTVNLAWVIAAAETNLGTFGNSQLRLWQTQSSTSDTGQYLQGTGLPQTSSVLPSFLPATQETSNHVISLTMW